MNEWSSGWLVLDGVLVMALGAIAIFNLQSTAPPLLAQIALVLSGIALAAQFYLRWTSAHRFHQPLRYWWLTWLGGALVVAIALTSIVKTATGWGWTWRGRSLAE